MYKFGGWNINVPRNAMPQKIATAFAAMAEQLIGASYEFVAYLGTQQVNGTNHAVLAQQTVVTGKDVNNAVVIVFNEKPGSMDVALTDIRRIVEAGGPLGGTNVNMSLRIPTEAEDAFNKVKDSGWVGAKIVPFAYVGSKVTKGTEYILVAEVTPMTKDQVTELSLVTVNALEKSFDFDKVFEDGAAEEERAASLGKPLGEWP